MTLSSHEIRKTFFEYFTSHGHTSVPSASLIPQADPTLLFTNAGMNQFKRVFLGEESRPYSRAVSIQKCMRAGGKHNDLENVGFTSRHHTFFEMLGNFSFGDYFKEEAIVFGWEYLTQTVGLPSDQLWVTVYREDDEAHQLWRQRIGVPSSRIVRLGKKDNFWQMGDTGPCGPCSEIHLDQGEALGCQKPNCGVGCDCDRYLEIWNLVFMQYDRDDSGTLHALPKPSIDTGMGLERLTAVVQGVASNYDTDVFKPLLKAVGDRTDHRYGTESTIDRSMRVIADHLRAITFLIADGVFPSNEGRGYVLRRILRRASRHGRMLGTHDPFLYDLTGVVVREVKDMYPELDQAATVIEEVVLGEEERFIGTLDQGLPLLNSLLAEAKEKGNTLLDGEAVFKLYDTYGFPLDLVEEAGREAGLTLDQDGYHRALEAQRDRARKSAVFSVAKVKPVFAELQEHIPQTQFVGYEQIKAESSVQALLKNELTIKEAVKDDEIDLILDKTPFYPEGGGQVGDTGILAGPAGRIEVRDTVKVGTGLFLHKGRVLEGEVRTGEFLTATVNATTRHDAARNHTATHLVHAALREVIGPHVKQYGSLVAPNRLRFDFSHFKSLSSRDIEEIESLVNEQIRSNIQVQTETMDIQDAVNGGALAFFGDKYGEQVRVVDIGSFSKELCGGTHCSHTGEIGLFRIVSEGGIAAGVRRIEALTGIGALQQTRKIDSEIRDLAGLLKVSPGEVLSKTKKLLTALKEREQEVEQLRIKLVDQDMDDALTQSRTINGIEVQVRQVDGLAIQELRTLLDKLRNSVQSEVLVLGSSKDGKVALLVMVSKEHSSRIPAGELAKCIAEEVGGSGGGRPEMAQAGGNRPEGLTGALDRVFEFVEKKVGSSG